MPRNAIPSRPIVLAALGSALAVTALLTSVGTTRQALARALGLPPSFQGATAGVPVTFETVPLPPVVVGPHNEPAPPSDFRPAFEYRATTGVGAAPGAFVPTFSQLVENEIVITDEPAMEHVWARLFTEPYDPDLFDFDATFVVMMGGGLMHPWFGFDVTAVEQFEATFSSPDEFGVTYPENALAVVGTTTLPGPQPKKMDPVYKVAAVKVPRAFLDDVIFNRQVIALP